MPQSGRIEVKAGGNASTFASEGTLPVITGEVVDFFRWLTANSGCSACESRPQCEAYQRRCPLFKPHHAEQDFDGLRHRLLNAIVSALEPAARPALSGSSYNSNGESADGNPRQKNASETNPEGDRRDKPRDDLLLIEDVIDRANLSLRKLRYDMASGALPYHKFGRATRFSPADVDAYIEARRIGRRRNNTTK